MSIRDKLVLILIAFCTNALAISTTDINQNMNSLMNKVQQLNADLTSLNNKKRNLDNAINDSVIAINQSNKLLNTIKMQRQIDVEQLEQINALIPTIESTLNATKKNIESTAIIIYQQMMILQNQSKSIVSTDENSTIKRKQAYLNRLLVIEQGKYQILQAKLDQLIDINQRLQVEVNNLNARLIVTAEKQKQFESSKAINQQQVDQLQNKIVSKQQKFQQLLQQRAALNKLLITLSNNADNLPHIINESYRNGQKNKFFSQQLAKPINSKPALTYGAGFNGTIIKGVLYKVDKYPVFAIAAGVVKYAGTLPGFGKVIIISHNNDYMSVYSGVIPSVSKNQKVTLGEIIANSGTEANQPMGGVYFELRHLGTVVNPNALTD